MDLNASTHVDQSSENIVHNAPEKASSKVSKYTVDISETAIAGLVGEEAGLLEVIKDSTRRVKPASLAWLPTGDFFVGCEDGQLFKVRFEKMKESI